MSIEEGTNRVAEIVKKHDTGNGIDPKVYGPFAVTVMEYADKSGLGFKSPIACNTSYNTHTSEIQFWYFGLMLCEYVAGLIGKKVDQGHCQEHRKKPDLIPCPETRPMHLEMLKQFRDALMALIKDIDSSIEDLKSRHKLEQ